MERKKYFHDWEGYENDVDIAADWVSYNHSEENLESAKSLLSGCTILIATYTYEDYSGSAYVLLEREGKLYEVSGGHCSCYGLEDQWELEETSASAVARREWDWGKEFAESLYAALEEYGWVDGPVEVEGDGWELREDWYFDKYAVYFDGDRLRVANKLISKPTLQTIVDGLRSHNLTPTVGELAAMRIECNSDPFNNEGRDNLTLVSWLMNKAGITLGGI